MNPSIISLLSISIGIIAGNIYGIIYKKHSLGFTGNTIAGVFGSILLIKMTSKIGIGIDPNSILHSENYFLLFVNLTVSLLGGSAVSVIYFLKHKMS